MSEPYKGYITRTLVCLYAVVILISSFLECSFIGYSIRSDACTIVEYVNYATPYTAADRTHDLLEPVKPMAELYYVASAAYALFWVLCCLFIGICPGIVLRLLALGIGVWYAANLSLFAPVGVFLLHMASPEVIFISTMAGLFDLYIILYAVFCSGKFSKTA